MGLDMFLYQGKDGELFQVGQWRKANQIHRWFVERIQCGQDNQGVYSVSYEELLELKTLCQQAIGAKDPSLLPPMSGSFFGTIEITEGYWDDIARTILLISRLSPDGRYFYQADW